jgi:hypothetical protein
MNPLLAEVGRILLGVVVADAARHMIYRSKSGAKPNESEKEMSYDLVGFDDDDYGSIGADLIGDEDSDLLEALAIEGDIDDMIGDDYDDDELIAGDGSSELVGLDRRRRRRSRRSSRKAAALKAVAMRNAGAVIKRGLDRRRRYPLGFVPTSVAATTSAAIPAAPQNLYRPERLVIPSDIAFDLGVRDIKVGNQSQLAQSAEVPAAIFSEVAINTGVTFDTAEVGNQVSVDVRNKSAATLEFSAGLLGSLAK